MTETETLSQLVNHLMLELGDHLRPETDITAIRELVGNHMGAAKVTGQRGAARYAERGGGPRERTDLERGMGLVQHYHKTVLTIVRELASYELIGSRGQPVADHERPGIAMAILDHIVGTGEFAPVDHA